MLSEKELIVLHEPFRLSELQLKEVVNVRDGKIFGRICDLEMDTGSGQIRQLVLPGRPRFFGFFGHEEGIHIDWAQIRLIGTDAILVDLPAVLCPVEKETRRRFSAL